MANNSISYLRNLNRHIKVKALAQLCGYSDDVIRAIFRKNAITHKQIVRIKQNLHPWVQSMIDGIHKMEQDIIDGFEI